MDKATKQAQPVWIEDIPVDAERAAEVRGGVKQTNVRDVVGEERDY